MADRETPKEIDFKPLTAGLGFHPFSEGMPYAPPSKKLPMGTGAMAAGTPRFVTPRTSAPLAKSPAPALVQAPVQAAPANKVGWDYPARRLIAWVLDSAFNTVLCFAALSVALWNQDLAPELLLNPGTLFVSGAFFAAFSWAIITAQEIAFGTTLGKRLFGLGLRGSTGAILLRAFLFIPSVGFAGAGLLWSLIDRRKRCWHDLVVDLEPVGIWRQ